MGSGGIAPRIFNLGSRWVWIVSFTSRTLRPRGKSLRKARDEWVGGPKSGLDAVARRKIRHAFALAGNRTPSHSPQPGHYAHVWNKVLLLWQYVARLPTVQEQCSQVWNTGSVCHFETRLKQAKKKYSWFPSFLPCLFHSDSPLKHSAQVWSVVRLFHMT
jgi:hypothetical protein